MACPYTPVFCVGVYHGKPSPEHQTEPRLLEPTTLRLPCPLSSAFRRLSLRCGKLCPHEFRREKT
jgi:hypothetical protein